MAALLLSVLMALLLCELAVRWFDVGPRLGQIVAANYKFSENPILRYEFRPGRTHLKVRINADGMRDRDYPVAKPPNTYRIACIGDSICAGFTLAQENTFSTRLEAMLNTHYTDAGQRFEVLNFGVTGYNITQAVENLRVKASKYQPDLVLYLYCINDPEDYSYEFSIVDARRSRAERTYFDRLSRGQRWFGAHSRLYALMRYQLEADTATGQKRPAVEKDPQFLRLRKNTHSEYYTAIHTSPVGQSRLRDGFTKLSSLAKEADIPAYVVLTPLLRDLDNYPLRNIQELVGAEAKQHSISSIDLLPTFELLASSIDEPLTGDDLHPSATATSMAAVAVLEVLLKQEEELQGYSGIEAIAEGELPEFRWAQLLQGAKDRPTGKIAQ